MENKVLRLWKESSRWKLVIERLHGKPAILIAVYQRDLYGRCRMDWPRSVYDSLELRWFMHSSFVGFELARPNSGSE